jgi:hypothetical protein
MIDMVHHVAAAIRVVIWTCAMTATQEEILISAWALADVIANSRTTLAFTHFFTDADECVVREIKLFAITDETACPADFKTFAQGRVPQEITRNAGEYPLETATSRGINTASINRPESDEVISWRTLWHLASGTETIQCDQG